MHVICTKPSKPPIPSALSLMLPMRLDDTIRRIAPTMIEEIRMHADRETTLTCCAENIPTGVILSSEEMQDILKKMCGGSLYAYAETISQGYLSLADGVRVGVCGTAAIENGQIIGVNAVSGLIVRIPHRVRVDAEPVMRLLNKHRGKGILLYAPPGVGKTTLLREVARQAASRTHGLRTVVVDTREELFYSLEEQALTLDILRNYPKDKGIEIAVRSLGAQLIICDEIGSREDADAILSAAGRGVPLIASAHAASIEELLSNPSLAPLCRSGIFSVCVGLSRLQKGFSYHITEWEEIKNK